MTLAAIDDVGLHGAEPLHDAANECIAELVACGTITQAERDRMGVPSRLRDRARLLEPFAGLGTFAGLTVEHHDIFRLPEAAWVDFGQHRNTQQLGKQRAGFFRSVFMPTLTEALDPLRSPADRLAFADALESGVAHRMAAHLSELPATGAVIAVARQPD